MSEWLNSNKNNHNWITVKEGLWEEPKGAIHWSELCRYLYAVARRQFRHIDNADVNQYALLIVFKITRQSENDSSYEWLWERLSSGASKRDIYLVPDTEQGTRYFANHPDSSILVREIKNIMAFFRKAFINLVISDLREDKRQKEIKSKVLEKTAPTRFRRTVPRSYPLDAFTNDLEQQRRKADLECALSIIQKMNKSMSRPEDSTVFVLFLQKYKPTEIAEITKMSESAVNNSIVRCKRKFQYLWKRVQESDSKRTS